MTFTCSGVEVLEVSAVINFPTHASTKGRIEHLIWPAGKPVLTLTLAGFGVQHLRENAIWSMRTNTTARVFIHHLRRVAGMKVRSARTLACFGIEHLGQDAPWSMMGAHAPTGGLVQHLR